MKAVKVRKVVSNLLLGLTAIALWGMQAFAEADTADLDISASGAIAVTLTDTNGDTVTDVSLSLYKAADLALENGDMHYVYTEEFSGCEIALSDVTAASVPKGLQTWVEKNEVTPVSVEAANENGEVRFEDLSVGLYLITQNGTSADHETLNPFVVSVPLDLNGTWVYEVDANPKVTPVDVKETESDTDDTPETEPESDQETESESTDETETESETDSEKESDTPPTVPNNQNNQNTPGRLPQTGQLNWPIPVLAIGGVVFLIIGCLLGRKKERRHAS